MFIFLLKISIRKKTIDTQYDVVLTMIRADAEENAVC